MSNYILTQDGHLYNVSNDELMHYGVMGMKWGVRRYQNKDGSLTAKGKNRFDKVASNERLAKRQTRQALSMHINNKKKVDYSIDATKRKIDKLYDKMDKQVWKSEAAQANGNNAKFQKYQSKSWKTFAKGIEAMKGLKYLQNESEVLAKKIDDINSGTIKAGRDFIVQTDYNIGALPIPGVGVIGGVSRERRIINR